MSSESTDQQSDLQARFAEVFAHLPEQDIEQFYAHYQLWLLRRRVPLIEDQLERLRGYLGENQHLIETLRPSAIAQAVLARLQSRGVSNIEILDGMLERGEDWLDRMMQRLDYCEQVEDFIQGDYNQWCIRSLEGAYDWIDTVLGLGAPGAETDRQSASVEDASGVQATEEMLLQMLRVDEEEGPLETTLKQPTITGEPASQDEREGSEPATTTRDEEVPMPAEASVQDEAEPTPAEPQLVSAPDGSIVSFAEEFLLVRESEAEAESEVPAEERATEPAESVVEGVNVEPPLARGSVPGEPPLARGVVVPVEAEEPEEMADWEDLESPELRPQPWYSVNLAADASSGAQPDTMHDWINVLQADAPQVENSVSEVAGASSEQLPTPAEDAPQTGSAEDEIIIVAEIADEPEHSVASHTEEVEEPQTHHSVEEASPEPIELSEEAERVEIGAEEEAARVEEEEEEVTGNAEIMAIDATEAVVIDERGVVEAAQEVELSTDESALVPPEVEATSESESASSHALAAEDTPANSSVRIEALEEASVAGGAEIEAAEQADVVSRVEVEIGEQSRVEDEMSEDANSASAVEIEAAEQTDVESEVEVVEETSVESAVEGTEIEPSNAEVEALEVGDSENAVEIEAAEQPDESAEISQHAAGEDQSSVHGAAPLVAPELTSVADQAAEGGSWGYVPVDDSASGEASNALPWYEYLTQDEQVAQMPHDWGEREQPAAPEEALSSGLAALSATAAEGSDQAAPASIEQDEPAESSETDSLEIASAAEELPGEAEIQTEPGEPTLQAEFEKLERARTEDQGREAFPEIDATQPMLVVKGKRQVSRPIEPEVAVGALEEEPHAVADESTATGEAGEAPGVEQTEPAASEPGDASLSPVQGNLSESPVALIRDEMRSIQDEMRAIQHKVLSIQSGINQVPVTPVEREEPVNEEPVNVAPPLARGAVPHETPASPIENEEPPVKVGFWRRLFGRRKKK